MNGLSRGARAAAVVSPIAVAAGALARPFTANLSNIERLAANVRQHPDRWAVGSLLMSLGYAGVAATTTSAISTLQTSGRTRRGSIASMAAIFGSAAVAFQLGGFGLGGLGAAEAGSDVTAVLDGGPESYSWIFGLSLPALGIAWMGLGRAAVDGGLVAGWRARSAMAGSVVALGGLLIPSSIGEYVNAAGLALLLWPLVGP